MKKYILLTFLHSLISSLLLGCSITQKSYNLLPPAQLSQDERNDISKKCMMQAKNLSNEPLTDEEIYPIKSIDTGKFFESGHGRTTFSDRYVLCFINNNYQLVEQL